MNSGIFSLDWRYMFDFTVVYACLYCTCTHMHIAHVDCGFNTFCGQMYNATKLGLICCLNPCIFSLFFMSTVVTLLL